MAPQIQSPARPKRRSEYKRCRDLHRRKNEQICLRRQIREVGRQEIGWKSRITASFRYRTEIADSSYQVVYLYIKVIRGNLYSLRGGEPSLCSRAEVRVERLLPIRVSGSPSFGIEVEKTEW
jgi:hypothetical protein